MQKTILQDYKSCSVQKPARKNTRYSRNETIFKIGHLAKTIAHAKAIAFPNGQFGSKIKNAKNMRKTILQDYKSCSVQKTARKNTKYSRNESIFKLGYPAKATPHAEAIDFAKGLVRFKN